MLLPLFLHRLCKAITASFLVGFPDRYRHLNTTRLPAPSDPQHNLFAGEGISPVSWCTSNLQLPRTEDSQPASSPAGFTLRWWVQSRDPHQPPWGEHTLAHLVTPDQGREGLHVPESNSATKISPWALASQCWKSGCLTQALQWL